MANYVGSSSLVRIKEDYGVKKCVQWLKVKGKCQWADKGCHEIKSEEGSGRAKELIHKAVEELIGLIVLDGEGTRGVGEEEV